MAQRSRRRVTLDQAIAQMRTMWKDRDPSTWAGQPWACPKCPAYLVPTLDHRHHACVTGEAHGIYVIHRGVRTEVAVEPDPPLP